MLYYASSSLLLDSQYAHAKTVMSARMNRREGKSVTVIDSHGQPLTFLLDPNEDLPSYASAVQQDAYACPSMTANPQPTESTPLLATEATSSPVLTVQQRINRYFLPLISKTHWKSATYLLLLNFPLHLFVWLLACV